MLPLDERITALTASEISLPKPADALRVARFNASMTRVREEQKKFPMATVFHFVRTQILHLLNEEYAQELEMTMDSVSRFGKRAKGHKGRHSLRVVLAQWQRHAETHEKGPHQNVSAILRQARELLAAAYVGNECYDRTYAYEQFLSLLTPKEKVLQCRGAYWEDTLAGRKRNNSLGSFHELVTLLKEFDLLQLETGKSAETSAELLSHPRVQEAQEVHMAHALAKSPSEKDAAWNTNLIELEQVLACHGIPWHAENLLTLLSSTGLNRECAYDLVKYRLPRGDILERIFEELHRQHAIDSKKLESWKREANATQPQQHPILQTLHEQRVPLRNLMHFIGISSQRALEQTIVDPCLPNNPPFALVAYAAGSSQRQVDAWLQERRQELLKQMQAHGMHEPVLSQEVERLLYGLREEDIPPKEPMNGAGKMRPRTTAIAAIQEIGMQRVQAIVKEWTTFYRPSTIRDAVQRHAKYNSYRMLEQKAGMSQATLQAIAEGKQTITSLPALRGFCEGIGIDCTYELIHDWMEQFVHFHAQKGYPDVTRVIDTIISISERVDKGTMPFFVRRGMPRKFLHGRNRFHATGRMTIEKQNSFMEKTPIPSGTPLRFFIEQIFATHAILPALQNWFAVMQKEFPALAEDCIEVCRHTLGDIHEDIALSDEGGESNHDDGREAGVSTDPLLERHTMLQTKFMVAAQRARQTTKMKDVREERFLRMLRVLQHIPGVTKEELVSAVAKTVDAVPAEKKGGKKLLHSKRKYEFSILSLPNVPLNERENVNLKTPPRARVSQEEGGCALPDPLAALTKEDIKAILQTVLDPALISEIDIDTLVAELANLPPTHERRLLFLGDTMHFPGSPERIALYKQRLRNNFFLSPSDHPRDIKDEHSSSQTERIFHSHADA